MNQSIQSELSDLSDNDLEKCLWQWRPITPSNIAEAIFDRLVSTYPEISFLENFMSGWAPNWFWLLYSQTALHSKTIFMLSEHILKNPESTLPIIKTHIDRRYLTFFREIEEQLGSIYYLKFWKDSLKKGNLATIIDSLYSLSKLNKKLFKEDLEELLK